MQTRPRHRDRTLGSENRRYRFEQQQVITPSPGRASSPPREPHGPVRSFDRTQLRRLVGDVFPGAPSTVSARRRAVTTVLEHLTQFDGQDWQQRWQASGLDAPGHPVRELGTERAGSNLTTGLAALCALRVIAPSLPAFWSNIMIGYPDLFRRAVSILPSRCPPNGRSTRHGRLSDQAG